MRPVRQLSWFLLASFVLVAFGSAVRADDLPRARPEAAGLSAEKLKRIDEAVGKAVEQKQIAGAVVLLARKGKVGYLQAVGMADAEAKKPLTTDAIFRLASMSKAVTSVAAMMLVEDGKLALDDPVSKYLPEFKNQKVLVAGKNGKDDFSLVPAERDVTVRDLLRHTAGLIYAFTGVNPQLVGLYTKAKINMGFAATTERLADNVKRLGELPLAHQPGKAFTYSLSTDVLGRVVEVASGKDLDEFFRERIFKPLGMNDTAFHVPAEKAGRVVVQYTQDKDKKIIPVGSGNNAYNGSKNYFSGGAGLLGTASDYARFLLMLQGGGKLGDVRLLKAETVKQMTQNQLGDIAMGFGMHGNGFGLGFGVVTPQMQGKTPMSVGAYSWGGAFYTHFWVDPSKELVAVLMAQVSPWADLKLREDFTRLVYEALAE